MKRISEKGQSLVEMGLVVPIILILLAGIVDIGRLFMVYNELKSASTEGVNYGSYMPSDVAGIELRMRSLDGNSIDLSSSSDMEINVVATGAVCQGEIITITATHQFTLATPLIGMLLGESTFPVSARNSGVILSPACN